MLYRLSIIYLIVFTQNLFAIILHNMKWFSMIYILRWSSYLNVFALMTVTYFSIIIYTWHIHLFCIVVTCFTNILFCLLTASVWIGWTAKTIPAKSPYLCCNPATEMHRRANKTLQRPWRITLTTWNHTGWSPNT